MSIQYHSASQFTRINENGVDPLLLKLVKNEQPITRYVWESKYRWNTADGAPLEFSRQESNGRIIQGVFAQDNLAHVYAPIAEAALNLYLSNPGGRIHAGAGTAKAVTLGNCYVSGTIEDNLVSIQNTILEAALTQQQGGGIGSDFSPIRPYSALVKRTGSISSGTIPFARQQDAMCDTIMSSGSRRGAMMLVLSIRHPDAYRPELHTEAGKRNFQESLAKLKSGEIRKISDIPVDFITAKQVKGQLENFNVSLGVHKDFMEYALPNNLDWDLVFDVPPADASKIIDTYEQDGKTYYVYARVKAAELWDAVTRATYDWAEPGVLFIDRVNEMNNLWYCEVIAATNPCVTGDTWVQTSRGPRQVTNLIGSPFRAVVDGEEYHTGPEGFFLTGHKQVYKVQTRQGYSFRATADHLVLAATNSSRYVTKTEWVEVGELAPGTLLVLNNHRQWHENHCEDSAGYLLGLLLGDGTIKDDKAVISTWGDGPGPQSVRTEAERIARTFKHRSDFNGWQKEISDRIEYRLVLACIKELAERYGMTAGSKTIKSVLESEVSFHAPFLRGLFDADGSVQGDHVKGASVRLAQSNVQTLEAVQRILLRFGIVSTIYKNRREAGYRLLPNGKGGNSEYWCDAQHELVIANESLVLFQDRIGFVDVEKQNSLLTIVRGYKRKPNRDRFVVEVESVTLDGFEDVYDVQVPGVNAFDANGLYVHNCGEQPLPPYGMCDLAAANYAMMVREPFTSHAIFDFDLLRQTAWITHRILDNVLDVTNYPLEEQRQESFNKRRVGQGFLGLGTSLKMLGLRYGSKESLDMIRMICEAHRDAVYNASVDLAIERGPFPLFDKDKFLQGKYIQTLPNVIRERIAEYGIRNGVNQTVAPTGNTAIYYHNPSSGIEDSFGFDHERNVLVAPGVRERFRVEDFGWRVYKAVNGIAPETTPQEVKLPNYMSTALDLSIDDHLNVMAVVQEYIDASISKTINIPENMPFEEFKEVYTKAYALGLKGCTTYRPSDVRGSVLVQTDGKDKKDPKPEKKVPTRRVKDRPDYLPGLTYKIPDGNGGNMFVTVNCDPDTKMPMEVFLRDNTGNPYVEHAGRNLSLLFRAGVPVKEIRQQLRRSGGTSTIWHNGKSFSSSLQLLDEVIFNQAVPYFQTVDWNFHDSDGAPLSEALQEVSDPAPPVKVVGKKCPNCDSPLEMSEGCMKCTSCLYSKCG